MSVEQDIDYIACYDTLYVFSLFEGLQEVLNLMSKNV